MNERRKVKLSKRLSYVLRHAPRSVGIELDESGWTDVDGLLRALDGRGVSLSRAELLEIVETSPKKRFALSDDSGRIRASQGHSVEVDLGYRPEAPPARLYHGTHPRAIDSIRATGLEPRGRHHVHLSADIATARDVGGRRGRPIILEVAAAEMHQGGARFFVSANGVWLVDAVPPEFLKEIREGRS